MYAYLLIIDSLLFGLDQPIKASEHAEIWPVLSSVFIFNENKIGTQQGTKYFGTAHISSNLAVVSPITS